MNQLQTFADSLSGQNVEVVVWSFVINLMLAAVLSMLLGGIYVRYGNTLSNRVMFARNFMLIAMTTMVVITIVKSSLALSLGLVGALSIVRFRAAIKEPEELAYLFMSIGVGLGLGADQRLITLIAFGLIAGIVWVRSRFQRGEGIQNLFLTVASHNPEKVELKEIMEVLKEHFRWVDLKRFDERKEMLEASFQVAFDDIGQLESGRLALRKLGREMRVTFLDNRGIV